MAIEYKTRCLKCKKEVVMQKPKKEIAKNGMQAVRGVCPKCGGCVYKFLGKPKK